MTSLQNTIENIKKDLFKKSLESNIVKFINSEDFEFILNCHIALLINDITN